MNTILKINFFSWLFFGFFGNAQETNPAPPQGSYVYQYDEAGNQIFRSFVCSNCRPIQEKSEPQEEKTPSANLSSVEDDTFWREIKIYPVPVKDILTIVWSDKVDSLIDEVSLYEQNTVHWKFQQKNIPNLNRQVQIDMTDYYMGVYILSFQLKDGKIISKNITKF